MPDEITIKPKSESNPTSSANENPTVTLNKSHLVGICAAGLLLCLFLPWTHFLGSPISGFDLQKLGNAHKLLWLIPICSAVTIFASFSGPNPKLAEQVTAKRIVLVTERTKQVANQTDALLPPG